MMRAVEDIENAAKLSASYDLIDHFNIGSYIDAHDGARWCSAQVTAENSHGVNIHFEAWCNKYDERDIPKKSSRLAPFRLHSVGYTGQLSRAYRNFNYDKAINTHNINELNKLIVSNFDSTVLQMTAYNFTQQYRGELFYYADSLLSMANECDLTLEDLPEIISFVESFFNLTVTWIEHFPSLRVEYTYSESYEYLYLTDFNSAVVRMYPELAEFMRLTFGETSRRMGKSFAVILLVIIAFGYLAKTYRQNYP